MKENKGKKQIWILLMLVMMGVGLYKTAPVLANKIITEEEAAAEQSLGIPIEAVKAWKEDLSERNRYIGTVQSKETVQISSKLPSEILELDIQEGSLVKKGQIIARLDSSALMAKGDTTQVKIEAAEYNLQYLTEEEEKYKKLFEAGGISEDAYNKIKHQKEMVQLQLKELLALKNELDVSLRDAIITSPIDGMVTAVNYSVGDLAMTAKPIAVIDHMAEIFIKAHIVESDLQRIGKETPALVKLHGAGEWIETKVYRIMPMINPKTRIGEVEIGPLKLKDYEDIKLGSSAEVEFLFKEAKEAVVIPVNAIKELTDKKVVYLIEGNQVQEVNITTGLRVGDKIQVLEGIKAGDLLAAKNIEKLQDSTKVYTFKGEDKK